MNGQYIKLYASSGPVDSAYFLTEGSVYFYVSNADKYAITGNNLIIGATEIIMKHVNGTDTDRIETVIAAGGSAVKRIPVDKFLSGLRTYSFALNAALALAKQVSLTSLILQKNMSELEGEGEKIRSHAIDYYTILNRLRLEYEKRRLPWMKEIIEEFQKTLTYKKGEAYCKIAEPVRMNTALLLSDKDVEYARGSVIVEENTAGSEMFILKSGAVDVFMKGRKIATINEPGTVIGESAILLGEKRTATLRAKNTVITTRIRKEELKEVAENQEDFFTGLVATLARRHYQNVARIVDVNRSIAELAIDRELTGGDTKAALSRRAHRELNSLKQKIEDSILEKKADFLNDLLNNR